jgi:hypothetical protein
MYSETGEAVHTPLGKREPSLLFRHSGERTVVIVMPTQAVYIYGSRLG